MGGRWTDDDDDANNNKNNNNNNNKEGLIILVECVRFESTKFKCILKQEITKWTTWTLIFTLSVSLNPPEISTDD